MPNPQTIDVNTLESAILIQEENLNPKELPSDIKNALQSIRMQVGKYNKTPNEELYRKIVKADVKLADMIQDHVEKGLPDEPSTPPAPPAEPTPPTPATPPEPPAPPKPDSQEELAAKIREKSSGGKISVSDVQQIMGNTVLKTIMRIGNVRLEKSMYGAFFNVY